MKHSGSHTLQTNVTMFVRVSNTVPATFHFLSASFCTHQQPKEE
jgi:hypothetical protein